MSKLHNEYCKLKNNNPNYIYLLKSGIFYICLEEDARTISQLFNFKLTNLNNTLVKCGLPVSQIYKYTDILNKHNINFQIVDNISFKKSEKNCDLNNILKELKQTNIAEINVLEAFNILIKLQKNLIKGEL